MKVVSRKCFPTGIVALDYALGGGLYMPSRVVIIGAPGNGKCEPCMTPATVTELSRKGYCDLHVPVLSLEFPWAAELRAATALLGGGK